ncbi:hypothetical protein AMECASPLE_037264 [Ameca splendens]|uniref:Uncharacterized protein n=1 Tax=Ameca splendens TaxID=208324 RepID=A0ABV1AGI2_9TELE
MTLGNDTHGKITMAQERQKLAFGNNWGRNDGLRDFANVSYFDLGQRGNHCFGVEGDAKELKLLGWACRFLHGQGDANSVKQLLKLWERGAREGGSMRRKSSKKLENGRKLRH